MKIQEISNASWFKAKSLGANLADYGKSPFKVGTAAHQAYLIGVTHSLQIKGFLKDCSKELCSCLTEKKCERCQQDYCSTHMSNHEQICNDCFKKWKVDENRVIRKTRLETEACIHPFCSHCEEILDENIDRAWEDFLSS